MIVHTAPSQNLVERHPVLAYFGLTLLFSWSVEIALIASERGWLDPPLPLAAHYLVSFGPMVAAILVTAIVGGRAALAELLARVTRWRVGGWWAVALLSPVLLFTLGVVVTRLVGGEWPDPRLLGQANYLPYLGIGSLGLFVATFGFGEEIGWRGYVLPRLQRTRSVTRATLMVGVMWAIWHAPAFLYLETYEKLGLIMVPGFVFSVLCGAVIFTWLYNGSRGSILMVALWHGLFDFFTATAAGQGMVQVVISGGVVVAALVLANANRPWDFLHSQKHAL